MYHFFLLCLPVTPAPSGAEMQKFVPQATAQFVIQLPTRTAPMILSQGFKFAKKKKKNQKTKNHKKSLSLFPTLPTGNSGSFRRKNAKVCTSPFISNCTLSYLRDLYAKYSSSYNNKIFFTKNEKINKYKLFCGKITTLSVYFAAIRQRRRGNANVCCLIFEI